jgi:hypothetical protein
MPRSEEQARRFFGHRGAALDSANVDDRSNDAARPRELGLLGAGIGRAIVWLRPRARAAAIASARVARTALRALALGAWSRRGALLPIGVRAVWWATLVLLVVAGHPIFDSFASASSIERAPMLLWLGLGASTVLAISVKDEHLPRIAGVAGRGR